MAGYKVYFRESVGKDCRVVPKKDVKKILERIDLLSACQQYFCTTTISKAS